MINIFQFLKQGTSLSRNAHLNNLQLQSHIIPTHRDENHSYQHTARFHDSDSEDEPQPETLDATELAEFKRKANQRSRQFGLREGIKVKGVDYPRALSNFTKIIQKYGIRDELIEGLGSMGYEKPTPVQMQVIPCLLEKRNVVVTAPTGTGKSLSFLLPILQNITPSPKIQAVILVPLQELAHQIMEMLVQIGAQSNVSYQSCSQLTEAETARIEQKKSPGYNILVATPLTFIKMFEERKVLLKHVQYVVIDQCDQCFQESFFEQAKAFLDLFSKWHPTYAFFSATIKPGLEEVLSSYLHDSVRVEVGGSNRVLGKINQSVQYCTNELGKLMHLKNMVVEGQLVPPVLIFVQSKQRAKQLYFQLKKFLKQQLQEGRRIEVLSSDKSKQERLKIITNFDQGKYWMLITTDIVARGIDFSHVNLVVNYDFPNNMLTYIHRVGRTARAQRTGSAVTFFTDEDMPLLRSLANLLKTSGCELPQWIQEMPKAKKALRKKLEKFPVKRLAVGKADGRDKEWEGELQVLEKRWSRIKRREEERADYKGQEEEGDSGGWQVV